MQSSRWKNASLAINAIIRGLELDQIAFHYDETASREVTAASDGCGELTGTSASLLRELPQLKGTPTAAQL